jgi:hypothetical protein
MLPPHARQPLQGGRCEANTANGRGPCDPDRCHIRTDRHHSVRALLVSERRRLRRPRRRDQLGPIIVSGLNYGDLLLQTRLNGEVVQSQRTKDLLFDVPAIVSYISRFVTLEPGDVIYTGTPGATKAMKPGDVVEVEIENVGVLRNRVERSTLASATSR